jgi:Ion channel
MLINGLLGLAAMAVCFMFEALLVLVALRYYARKQEISDDTSFWEALKILLGVLIVLVVGILGQVGLWAILFVVLGEFSTFEAAFYHSAVNFSTLGYGDVVMSEAHKLLGPLQAINGVLMIGVSTAVVMATIQDSFKKTILARRSH